MFDSTNPRHTELLTKVLDSFAEAIDQAHINVMEKLEASFSTPEVAGTGDELSMINLELSYAAKDRFRGTKNLRRRPARRRP